MNHASHVVYQTEGRLKLIEPKLLNYFSCQNQINKWTMEHKSYTRDEMTIIKFMKVCTLMYFSGPFSFY